MLCGVRGILSRGRGEKVLLLSKTGDRQVWIEYMFGICKPDHRNGKPGNR